LTGILGNLSGKLDKRPILFYTAEVIKTKHEPGRKTKLANRLRIARAEKNLSQDELARLSGVTRQTISSIETGQYCPSALLAFVLAEQLGKRIDEIFFLEEFVP
jgi:putative transcriptional regulator